MKKLTVLVLMAVVLAAAGIAYAAEKVPLFKNFTYGATQDEITKLIKVSKCGKTTSGNDALCVSDYSFFGKKWKLILIFNDGKLFNVRLQSHFNQNGLMTLFNNLYESFVLIAAQGGNGLFDYVDTIFTSGIDKATVMLGNFEVVAKASGPVTYAFIDKKGFEALVKDHRSAQGILMHATQN